MTTPTLAPMLAVSEYARRVREHLADLTADEVAELTEGMEADLVEALLESPAADDAMPTLDQVTARFGAPAAYAAELRSAAGLPVRRAGSPGSRWLLGMPRHLLDREVRLHRDLFDRLESQPWWPGTKELASTMRPVWWVARAYVIAMLGTWYGYGVLPRSGGHWLVLVVLLVLSVQWGRGRLGRSTLSKTVGYVASAVAVLAFFPVLSNVTAPETVYETMYEDLGVPGPGVYLDGEQVRSFHAYDAAGNPIERFQLFDDQGRPVVTVPDPSEEFYVGASEQAWHSTPPLDVYGTAVNHAYPLQIGRWSWLRWDEAKSVWQPLIASKIQEAPRPFERVIPLDLADDDVPAGTELVEGEAEGKEEAKDSVGDGDGAEADGTDEDTEADQADEDTESDDGGTGDESEPSADDDGAAADR